MGFSTKAKAKLTVNNIKYAPKQRIKWTQTKDFIKKVFDFAAIHTCMRIFGE